jgi:lipopolysaccharide transport system ATP-binding protein
MKPAIRVEQLSKLYHIGRRQNDSYRTLREAVASAAAAPFKSLRKRFTTDGAGQAETTDAIWALKDISFEVQPGEVVGIVGRNGSGKSTLLKVLSRITEPTHGRVELRGRVGSLLEVGTGFHSELTGRENIYLNGAILGMTRREITRKFDAIVAFAEVDEFLDTPVKRYSSGMYVRLAFAVAAHLEPEILLVDEVLAVGDLEFQKKCIGKMQDFGHQGRTVLFVSHSMGALQSLCQTGLLLQKGVSLLRGDIDATVNAYVKSMEQRAAVDLRQRTDRPGLGRVRLAGLEVGVPGEGPGSFTLTTGMPARFTFDLSEARRGLNCMFTIFDGRGTAIARFSSVFRGPEDVEDPGLTERLICDLDELLLPEGRYYLNVILKTQLEVEDLVEGAAFFEVKDGAVRGRAVGRLAFTPLAVHHPHRWTVPQ